jgi:hypothetical protein
LLKKRTKKLFPAAYAAGDGAIALAKVFCFFSSEKKTFLAHLHAPAWSPK